MIATETCVNIFDLGGTFVFTISGAASPLLLFNAPGLSVCGRGRSQSHRLGLSPVMAALLGMLTGIGGADVFLNALIQPTTSS
jgi:hypothetical protein